MTRSTEQRKIEIMEAALACFAEIGFAGTTIEHIRERSNASTGSIYHHFGNKEGIAGALYLYGKDLYWDGLLSVLEKSSTAEALVKSVVAHHLQWTEENPDWARYLLYMRRDAALKESEDRLRESTAAYLSRVGVIFRPLVERGDIAQYPKELYIPLIIGPAQEVIRHWLAGRSDKKPTQVKDVLSEAAWRIFNPG